MPDLNELDRAQVVKIAGANPSTGIADNFLEVDTSGRLTIKLNDASGSAINLGQGLMADSLPVTIASNQSALPVSQSGIWTTGRTWTLASGTDSVSAVQSGTWTVQPGNTANTTPWLVTANQGTANSHSNAWFTRLTDGTRDSIVTATGDLQVADILNTGGQSRAQSVTTSAAEALGAATILANRKMLSITPTNGIVYWGFTSGVTTANGSPIFKNQEKVFSVGPNVHIYLIAGSTVDCRIAEGS